MLQTMAVYTHAIVGSRSSFCISWKLPKIDMRYRYYNMQRCSRSSRYLWVVLRPIYLWNRRQSRPGSFVCLFSYIYRERVCRLEQEDPVAATSKDQGFYWTRSKEGATRHSMVQIQLMRNHPLRSRTRANCSSQFDIMRV